MAALDIARNMYLRIDTHHSVDNKQQNKIQNAHSGRMSKLRQALESVKEKFYV